MRNYHLCLHKRWIENVIELSKLSVEREIFIRLEHCGVGWVGGKHSSVVLTCSQKTGLIEKFDWRSSSGNSAQKLYTLPEVLLFYVIKKQTKTVFWCHPHVCRCNRSGHKLEPIIWLILWNQLFQLVSNVLFWLVFPIFFPVGGGGIKAGIPTEPMRKMAFKCRTFSSTQENQIFCNSCDSQKPMIMKEAWYFPCTLLVFKLCGPPQHNMLSCRKISLTSQKN